MQLIQPVTVPKQHPAVTAYRLGSKKTLLIAWKKVANTRNNPGKRFEFSTQQLKLFGMERDKCSHEKPDARQQEAWTEL